MPLVAVRSHDSDSLAQGAEGQLRPGGCHPLLCSGAGPGEEEGDTEARGEGESTHMRACKLAYTWPTSRLLGPTFRASADRSEVYLDSLDAVRARGGRRLARPWTA